VLIAVQETRTYPIHRSGLFASHRQTILPRANTIFQQYLDRGELSLRVYFAGSLGENTDGYQRYVDLQNQYPMTGDWLRFGFLKGYIDGTLGSGTMLVFEPFEDEPEKTGLPRMEYEELERRVIAADKLGLQIGIHAIGTKANRWILNAFEAAQKANGVRDSRHRSEHAQILHPDDIPRFGELGVIPSMQPTHAITDKRFAEKRIGTERSRAGAYVWRSLLDAGARIAFGTDYGVEPLDPLEGLFAGVTRKDRFDESDRSWFPEQLLTLEETIELYTLGSAYAEFMEDDAQDRVFSGYRDVQQGFRDNSRERNNEITCGLYNCWRQDSI